MACGTCRKTGHTKRTCPVEAVIAADEREATQEQARAMKLRREQGAAAPYADPARLIGVADTEAMSHNHTHVYRYGDDDNGHEGSFCSCGAEEPDTILSDVFGPDLEIKDVPAVYREAPAYLGQAATDPVPTLGDFFQGGSVTVTVDMSDDPERFETIANIVDPPARFDPAAKAAEAVARFLGVSSDAPTPELNADTLAADIDAFFSTPPPEDKPKRQQTNQYGYLLKDPVTGDFRRWNNGNVKGITRCTTFNKAASDQTAIKDWSKRNVLVGASRRPDLVAKAHKLDVSVDKAELNALVEKLEEAADAKVSADIGTMVHDYTERIDAGEITLADVPPMYRGHVASYTEALLAAGLKVVPSLIEGTVFIPEFGGVAGKFDRVLEHTASGTHVMGDLKTGKNMVYGWDEIETQEAIYTSGYNRFGTYVWAADPTGDSWDAPDHQVRTDVGVVMWLPVQEPTKPYPAGFTAANPPRKGVCYLLQTDLERGWRHAELCGRVREARAGKGKPAPWSAPERSWAREFKAVPDVAAAGRLWEQAREAGIGPSELLSLVKIAQDSLRARADADRCGGCGEPKNNGQVHGHGAEFGGCA